MGNTVRIRVPSRRSSIAPVRAGLGGTLLTSSPSDIGEKISIDGDEPSAGDHGPI